MGELIQFKKIADEITIRESDGVGVVSLRGAARLAGVSAEAISKAFKSVNQKPSKLARNLIEQGFDGVNLLAMLETGITDEAMAVIAHYYAYAASRFCTAQAKHTSKQFEKLGARAAFYAFKGLTLGQQPPRQLNEPKPQLPPTAEALQVQPKTKPQATPTLTSTVDAAKQMSGFVLELLNDLEIGQTPKQDKSLKVGVAISAAQIYCPEIADALNPAQKLLAATTATDGVYLTPTTLGERLGGLSGRKINEKLITMGLQTRVDKPAKGEPKYLPTQAGKPYSMMTMATGQYGDTTSYQHLKWSERVLKLFEGGVAA
ncbi:hypothetical protein D0962_34670 [Leptolyngbyaceae cyanobacterium CCMR0082]|uniref:Uncharacterized protein n=1 Tax=Adonisia turfae CCMR0082 TaxID=2304604 RepID=A0A6M0SIM2_9CYAN|nr:hypothetical protein [Adonisia turfae]NEZ67843.1 hypothetical protein [Adonisia turfae CCMR0082]